MIFDPLIKFLPHAIQIPNILVVLPELSQLPLLFFNLAFGCSKGVYLGQEVRDLEVVILTRDCGKRELFKLTDGGVFIYSNGLAGILILSLVSELDLLRVLE